MRESLQMGDSTNDTSSQQTGKVRANQSRPSLSPVTPQPPTKVRVGFIMNEALYDKFHEQAIAHGRATAEEEMAERLHRCQDYTSMSPLYFSDQERSELERAMGHNLQSAAMALAQLKNAVTLEVGEVKIELSPRLQQRIRSRVFRGHSYESVLRKEVIEALEKFAGLRPY
jgi:hypothetical protein